MDGSTVLKHEQRHSKKVAYDELMVKKDSEEEEVLE
jgi:hypothetical protein